MARTLRQQLETAQSLAADAVALSHEHANRAEALEAALAAEREQCGAHRRAAAVALRIAGNLLALFKVPVDRQPSSRSVPVENGILEAYRRMLDAPELMAGPDRERIAALKDALGEALATFSDQGAEHSVRSAWTDPAQLEAWHSVQRGEQ